jgi:hypothetical protein
MNKIRWSLVGVVFNDSELIDYQAVVDIGMVEIHQPNFVALGSPLKLVLHFHAIGQQLVESFIGCQQLKGRDSQYLIDRPLTGIQRNQGIEPCHSFAQTAFQKHIAEGGAFRMRRIRGQLGAVDIGIALLDQQFDG